MDLTKTYPRSVHDKWLGIVQLGRALDKAKAKASGNLGEYSYDCPMDKGVFEFLGIDAEEFFGVVKNASSDAEIEAYAKKFIDKKSPDEIDQWNREWVTSNDSSEFFLNLRNQVAPARTDVTNWADLLDLDEKRPVPKRETAAV